MFILMYRCYCPSRPREMTSFSAQDESFSIYEFRQYLDKHMKFFENDEWLDNSR